MKFVPLAIFVSGLLIAQSLESHKFKTKEEIEGDSQAYATVLLWGSLVFFAIGLFS